MHKQAGVLGHCVLNRWHEMMSDRKRKVWRKNGNTYSLRVKGLAEHCSFTKMLGSRLAPIADILQCNIRFWLCSDCQSKSDLLHIPDLPHYTLQAIRSDLCVQEAIFIFTHVHIGCYSNDRSSGRSNDVASKSRSSWHKQNQNGE